MKDIVTLNKKPGNELEVQYEEQNGRIFVKAEGGEFVGDTHTRAALIAILTNRDVIYSHSYYGDNPQIVTIEEARNIASKEALEEEIVELEGRRDKIIQRINKSIAIKRKIINLLYPSKE